MTRWIWFVLLFSNILPGYSDELDSLLKLSATLKADTQKIRIEREIGYLLNTQGRYADARIHLNEALRIGNSLGDHHLYGKIYNDFGRTYFNQGNLAAAKDDFEIALKYDQKDKNLSGIASGYNNLGTVYHFNGDHVKAMSNYLTAQKYYEELKDTLGICKIADNLGILYREQKLYEKSEASHLYAYKLNQRLKNPVLFAKNNNNLANLYKTKGDYSKALTHYRTALEYKRKTNDPNGEALCLAGIAEVHGLLNAFDSSESYYKRSIELFRQTEDVDGVVNIYNNLVVMYNQQGRYKEAYQLGHIALDSARGVGRDLLSDAYISLADASYNLGEYKKAFELLRQGKLLNDTIFNEENSSRINDLITRFEVEKKETELNAKAEIERKKSELIMYGVGGILFVSLVFSGFIYNRFKVTSRQKDIIESQKKEITDSINYAKKIQSALLPAPDSLKEIFPQHFLLYLPKDILSGDFYWIHRVNDQEALFAVADCTGHGVPGSFVSSICMEKLNEAALVSHSPSEILAIVNRQIKKTFRSTNDSGTRDGMDIALCYFNRNSGTLKYAGANRNLFIISDNGDEKEIKATKASIAGHTSSNQQFEEVLLMVNNGDQLFLSTDGFTDQFGGEKGKKLGTRKSREIFSALHKTEDIKEQEKELVNIFKDWKRDLEQVDDVTVFSVRF